MKKCFLIAFILLFGRLYAQKSMEGMIRAERSFAAYSVVNGTKDAFLRFLDSNGIVFENSRPANGIRIWLQKEKAPGVLNWTPQFAEISSGKDFGYTSGPWTFQPGSLSDSVTASGQFTTVWQSNEKGEWKFLVDLGVSSTPGHKVSAVKKIIAQKQMQKNPDTASLLKAEMAFIDVYQQKPDLPYQLFLSRQSILNRNGQLPATTSIEKERSLANVPPGLKFVINGMGISPVGDMAFIYGSVTLDNKTDNYLHIWRNEKHGWKLALEVLRY